MGTPEQAEPGQFQPLDEINRGELSKIFGELFYAIDPGYRGITGKINQWRNKKKFGNNGNIFY